ncbi:helix-turn-helix domain-containing protein, partial [Exiguobacterium chiriqhucha]
MYKYIGNIIRFNRIKAKKTQHEVATGICSISHLSKIEKGVYLPNQETLHLLLERLGKKIDFEKDQHQRLVKLIDDF